MAVMARKYTAEQKEAVVSAYLDRGVKRRRILELAAAGELPGSDGEPLAPFEMPDGSAAAYIRDEKKRRAGRIKREIAAAPARDAIEQLRRRCVSAADALLDHYEKQLRSNAKGADPERLRQIVRVVREAAALPGPTEQRPPKPGAKAQGERNGGETKGGLAGDILRDVETSGAAQAEPLRDAQAETDAEGKTDATSHAARSNREEGHETTRAGSLASALAEQRAGFAALARSNGS